MKKLKQKPGTLFITLGLLLMAAALFWGLYNVLTDWRGGQSSEQALTGLHSIIPRTTQKTVRRYTEITSYRQVPDYVQDPEMPMPVWQLDGVNYIGILTFPTLDLELPVSSQWNYDLLKLAPCRYTGSAYQGNLVIAGHNFRSHFGPLTNLTIGDPVEFTDTEGNLFSYTVALIDALNPEDVKEMTESEYPLTLFTCTLGGQYRVTIRCESAEPTT